MGMLKYISDKLYSNDDEVALSKDTLVESGGDADSSWVKFPDGRVIASGRGASAASTILVTNVYCSPLQTIAFPFTILDPIVISGIDGATDTTYCWSGGVHSLTTANFKTRFFTNNNSSNGTPTYTVTGRWK